MYAVLETSNDLTATTSIWADARCRDGAGTLTHLFFSDELLDIARAKAICARCTLRAECLDGALERAEPWGVWGGELIENGQLVVNKRPRGRPPKHARPILVVDEDRRVTELALGGAQVYDGRRVLDGDSGELIGIQVA
jgi:transcription factor WhiB